jgi:hypothetical protein
MAKKQISAKEVLQDIKSGLSDEELMTKFGLSLDSLESLFKQMMDAGILNKRMLDNRTAEFSLEIDTPAQAPRHVIKSDANGIVDVSPDYLYIFSKIEEGKLVKWNWYCFLLYIIWYIYKGMWQKGLVYFGVGILAAGITFWAGGIGGTAVWLAVCLLANWDYYLYKVHGETFFTKNWLTWWHGKFPEDLPRKIVVE